MKNIEKLLSEYHEWATMQFPNSTANSSLEGLKREIKEVENEISNSEFNHKNLSIEYVDCLMYILDSARRAGVNTKKLFEAFEEKLEINKNRDWKINEDKSYSHIK